MEAAEVAAEQEVGKEDGTEVSQSILQIPEEGAFVQQNGAPFCCVLHLQQSRHTLKIPPKRKIILNLMSTEPRVNNNTVVG